MGIRATNLELAVQFKALFFAPLQRVRGALAACQFRLKSTNVSLKSNKSETNGALYEAFECIAMTLQYIADLKLQDLVVSVDVVEFTVGLQGDIVCGVLN